MKSILKRLWVQLSLAFTLITLLAFTVVAFVSQTVISQPFVRSAVEDHIRGPDGPTRFLEDYYRDHGNWGGLDDAFAAASLGDLSDVLFIADPQGHIVFGQGEDLDLSMDRPPREPAIVVDDQIVGYMGLNRDALDAPNDLQDAVLRNISRTLLVSAVVLGITGVLVGVIVSRFLSAPLRRLAVAARAIGAGELDQRVAVGGSQEIATVAQAFNDMAGALEQAERVRRNMVADVAHELRTPLTVLQGNLQALLDDIYPLNKEEIGRLYTQTELLSRLVADLRLLSQADVGQLSLSPQVTDPVSLVSTVAEAFDLLAAERGVTLDVDLPESLPPVSVDVARIRQVLHNLLDNALRHTPAGETVAVTLIADADWLTLTVKDAGEGILAEHLAHIFDRFYRADSARSRDSGGAGLGLAIARSLVLAHGGTITAESTGIAGEGSTFTVCLPLFEGEDSVPATAEDKPPS